MRVPALLRTGVTRSEYLAGLRARRAGRPCAAPGCARISGIKTFCTRCYSRVRRTGSPFIARFDRAAVSKLAEDVIRPFLELLLLTHRKRAPNGTATNLWRARREMIGPALREALELLGLHLQNTYKHAQALTADGQKVPPRIVALAHLYRVEPFTLLAFATAALVHLRSSAAVTAKTKLDSDVSALAVAHAVLKRSGGAVSRVKRDVRLYVGRVVVRLAAEALRLLLISWESAANGDAAELAAISATRRRVRPGFSPAEIRAEAQKAAARDYIRERRRDAGYVRRERQRARELAAGAPSKTGRPRTAPASFTREAIVRGLESLLRRTAS